MSVFFVPGVSYVRPRLSASPDLVVFGRDGSSDVNTGLRSRLGAAARNASKKWQASTTFCTQ